MNQPLRERARLRCASCLTQFRVAAVTETTVLGVLATAPSHGFGFLDVHLQRAKYRTLVRTVTKRLALGLAAAAPIKRAGLGGLNVRRFCSNFWFIHNRNLAVTGTSAICILSPSKGSMGCNRIAASVLVGGGRSDFLPELFLT